MTARRFFIEGQRAVGNTVEIEGGDAHKIARVLRLRAGDRIEIVDSTATAFAASVDATGRVVHARLIEVIGEHTDRRTPLTLDVAQAVPKGRRMELVVEKCTELGAGAFLPFYCERSVGRRVGEEKLARWQRLARTAAQQCGRRDVPQVRDPKRFDELLACFYAYSAVLFAWELAPAAPLYELLQSALPAAGRVLVVVGPEGGFTHDEAEAARQSGAVALSLGPRILRTDTAAIVLLAVIGALTS
ncbi:MAG TPA: RsmE family RNA methyltransferase [Candidatus Dormibacteraeota bacterium]|nr:RsmE family RNA methyltransferase [Candidatus Dormibacteraeota bacterium]